MPRPLASKTLPLVALAGAALCAGGASVVDRLATPGRQPTREVLVHLEPPPAQWRETMQLRTVCDESPFRTFTVSPSAWSGIQDWETTVPATGESCVLQVRLLPSTQDWLSVQVQEQPCTLSVDPLGLAC